MESNIGSKHRKTQNNSYLMLRQLKESDIRPREIPSPKDSVFLANMRSHKKVFHRLAEFGKMPREPGANSLEGVENDLRSTENGQNESHLQDQEPEAHASGAHLLGRQHGCAHVG